MGSRPGVGRPAMGKWDPQFARHSFDVHPADFGIRTELLAFDEGDLMVAEVGEVLQGDFRGAFVIQNDVGDTVYLVVSRYSDDGHGERERPGSVDRDQAVHGSLEEE